MFCKADSKRQRKILYVVRSLGRSSSLWSRIIRWGSTFILFHWGKKKEQPSPPPQKNPKKQTNNNPKEAERKAQLCRTGQFITSCLGMWFGQDFLIASRQASASGNNSQGRPVIQRPWSLMEQTEELDFHSRMGSGSSAAGSAKLPCW